MINLNNYESWFMLYVDNELSAEERNLVMHFIQENPFLQEELDQILLLKIDAEEGVAYHDKSQLRDEAFMAALESSLRIEPDLEIRYPNKQELYKRAPVVVSMWRRSLQVAAALIIGVLLFINRPIDKGQTLNGGKDLHGMASNKVDEIGIKQPTHDVALQTTHIKHASKQTYVRINKEKDAFSDELVPIDVNENAILVQPLQESTSAIKTTSNFSEEAIKAAAARNADVVTTAIPNENQGLEVVNEEPQKSKKTPLRGLLRKISRTIMKENEENDGRNYVHVASFSIPVSKTNNK